MRVRSTGLGNQEMICQIDRLKIIDGHLLMNIQAIEPVRWRIRVALTYKDILRLLRVGTFVILTYLVAGFKTIFSIPPPPTNY